jgi:hypothetical protein
VRAGGARGERRNAAGAGAISVLEPGRSFSWCTGNRVSFSFVGR